MAAERVPYGKRNWYAHMKPYDVAIWERFMAQFPDMYDECEYDVLVGTPPEFITNDPDPAIRGQASLYQRKIDVVAFKGGQIDIIEIGPSAGTNKIGQVNAYKSLYIRDYQPPVEPKAIVLTDRLLADMNFLAADAGVFMVVA